VTRCRVNLPDARNLFFAIVELSNTQTTAAVETITFILRIIIVAKNWILFDCGCAVSSMPREHAGNLWTTVITLLAGVFNDSEYIQSDTAQYTGFKRKLSSVNFVVNMGLMLNIFDDLTELWHLSNKLQDIKTALSEAHRPIYLKYHVFQSMIHDPGEYYEQAQNAANELEFQRTNLEGCGKAQKNQTCWFLKKVT
jgi:hypothetical protein